MKSYRFARIMLASFVLIALFTACSKDEGGNGSLLKEDTGMTPPRFNDSWGYLEAYKILMPVITGDVEDDIEYSQGSLVADAYFLTSAGSSTFDQSGGGNVTLNGSALTNLFGAYLGSSSDVTKAEWQVAGNANVTGFSDSFNSFISLTGLTIPSWSACSTDGDLTITLHGNTADANLVYVECESKPGLVYGDDKFLTKTVEPGTMTCTITAEELTALKNYYSLGFTLSVQSFVSKKTTSGGRSYYLINGTTLTHAVYFIQEEIE